MMKRYEGIKIKSKYASAGQDKTYISKFYDSVNHQWIRVDKVNANDKIHIFDSENSYEKNHDIAYALITNDNSGNPNNPSDPRRFVEITLKTSPGGENYSLNKSYIASEMSISAPYEWTFSSGKSAGVCVDDGLFYQADTSDLSQPFSDGFVTFHISDYGIDGSGVVPYLPKDWFCYASDGNGKNGLAKIDIERRFYGGKN